MADQNCRIRSQGKRESGKIRGNLEAPSHNTSTALENATQFWYWAVMQAAYEYRCQILGTPLPDTAPRFGDRVLIQKPLPHSSFQSKVEEGRFLSWDTTTLQGALVATVRSGSLKVVSASAPLPWPKSVNERNEKWVLLQKPNSRERVWVGSLGGVIWDAKMNK